MLVVACGAAALSLPNVLDDALAQANDQFLLNEIIETNGNVTAVESRVATLESASPASSGFIFDSFSFNLTNGVNYLGTLCQVRMDVENINGDYTAEVVVNIDGVDKYFLTNGVRTSIVNSSNTGFLDIDKSNLIFLNSWDVSADISPADTSIISSCLSGTEFYISYQGQLHLSRAFREIRMTTFFNYVDSSGNSQYRVRSTMRGGSESSNASNPLLFISNVVCADGKALDTSTPSGKAINFCI